MLICKGQKMSNFIFSSIVVLYLYYNTLVEECKGQKLSVLILVSQCDGKEEIFPVVIFCTSILIEFGYVCTTTYKHPFPQYATKSPTLCLDFLVIGIVHLACSNILYHRWRHCKGQIMSVLV